MTAQFVKMDNGTHFICPAFCNYQLPKDFVGYASRRAAIASIRCRGDYSHYLSPQGRKVML